MRSSGSPITGAFFVGCVVTWAVFTLQDSVLTGLRSAVWVLVENGLFGVVKIVLLVAFASRLPHLGIYLSWMVPALAAVPLVNALIYRRLVPRHTAATLESAPPTSRQIGRFLAGDYSGAMFLLATTSLVPVLVAVRIADVRLTAYFYMAWMVGGVLDLVGVNMAMSLTVEGSFDASTLAVNCRKALRKIAGILLPCAALTALLAEWALGLFGPGYAEYGAPVLRAAGRGHPAPGGDRGLPGRAPGPEPDLPGRDHPGQPLRADARADGRPRHLHGPGGRRAGRGPEPGRRGPGHPPGPAAGTGGRPGRRAPRRRQRRRPAARTPPPRRPAPHDGRNAADRRGRPPGDAAGLAGPLAQPGRRGHRRAGRGRVRALPRLAARRRAVTHERAGLAVGAAGQRAGRRHAAGPRARGGHLPAPAASGRAGRRAGRAGHLPGRGDRLRRARAAVPDGLPDRRLRAVRQQHRARHARPRRVLQLAGLLRADLPGHRGGRDAQPAAADAGLAGDDRPAVPPAVLPADAQPADLLAGEVGGRAAVRGGQLGGPGLLLAAVLQLRALPGLPGHPGELVHRAGAQPAAPGPGDRAGPGAPAAVRDRPAG